MDPRQRESHSKLKSPAWDFETSVKYLLELSALK